MASKFSFFSSRRIRGRFAIAHDFRGISFGFQIEAQALRQMRFVLHHQNPAHASRPRQFHRDGRALPFPAALGKDFAAVLLRNRFHDEQSQPCSFHMRQRTVGDPIEALENTFQIIGRNAHALILNAEHDAFFVGRIQAHAHVHVSRRNI